jgi:D-proline reductase (dithiol) PrdB
MASFSELSLSERLFLLGYRFRRVDPIPWAGAGKPLCQARVALISTGGVFLPEQEPFDPSCRGGDFTYREIPSDTDVSRLRIGQRSQAFDHCGFERDRNLAFPLARLSEMAGRREIGSLSPRAISVMGSITATGRFVRSTVPAIAECLRQDGVEAALLIPV